MARTEWGFGGVPTEPDVDKLMKAFEIPDKGRLITYGEIEDVLEIERTETRFRTVTHQWRKRLAKEHNLISEAEPTVGFRFLLEPERVGHVHRRLRRSIRENRKAHVIAMTTDRDALDEHDQKRLDHQILVTGKTLEHVRALMAKKAPRLTPTVQPREEA